MASSCAGGTWRAGERHDGRPSRREHGGATVRGVDLRSTVSIVGGLPVVAFSGSVDLATLPQLRDPLLRATIEHPGRRIVVDLDGIDVLDDSGLGILLGVAGRAREGGGDLVVVTTNLRIRERFTVTGFARAVELAASVSEVRPLPA